MFTEILQSDRPNLRRTQSEETSSPGSHSRSEHTQLNSDILYANTKLHIRVCHVQCFRLLSCCAVYLPEGNVTFLYFCVGILKFKVMNVVTKLLDLVILRSLKQILCEQEEKAPAGCACVLSNI